MTFKKGLFLAALALMLGAKTASATEGQNVCKFSVGYQGLGLAGGEDTGWVNGISSRYWINSDFALEGNFYYSAWSHKDGEDGDVDDNSVVAATVKGLYAPVVKENSRFYLGLEAGLGNYHYENNYDPTDDWTDTFWLLRPMVGAEYNFPGLPEVGLNFEIGYLFSSLEDDGTNDDYDLSGVSVGFGAHYYF